jgi:hypothetical protein
LYKEDFNKFIKGLNEAVDYVKTELMPDFDFDAFNHEDSPSSGDGEYVSESSSNGNATQETPVVAQVAEVEAPSAEVQTNDDGLASEEVDKW